MIDEEDGMDSLKSLTTEAAGSMADEAAHDHHGDDEQRDLEEHHETGSSSEGRHRPRLRCLALLSCDEFELCVLLSSEGPYL